MTIVENTLRRLLIQANVGFEKRVFLMFAPQVPAPQQKWPYCVFFHVAPNPLHDHGGPLDLLIREYQVSIFDPSQSKALAIADSLRNYLDGYRGTFEDTDFGGIFYMTQTGSREPDTELFHIVQEYRIQFKYLPITAVTTAVTTATTGE